MRTTSFDVRFQKTYVYKGKKGNTYWVRWTVAGEPFKEKFRNNSTQAESYRSKLMAAARDGEAFDRRTGEPVSWERPDSDMPFYDLARAYVEDRWADSSAKQRANVAEALMYATIAMLTSTHNAPEPAELRRALRVWAFNKKRMDELETLPGEDQPKDVLDILEWVDGNTRAASLLANTEEIEKLLKAMNTKLDGKPRSSSCKKRNRSILYNLCEHAVKNKLLIDNPISHLEKSKKATMSRAIDERQVANPDQVRRLLEEAGRLKPSGRRFVAFFGVMAYAGLRTEEAAALRVKDLDLPNRVEGEGESSGESDSTLDIRKEWGTLYVRNAAPHAGGIWTDSGRPRDSRGLKQRAEDDVRPVPCRPKLVAMLRTHLDEFKPGPDNRVFSGPEGGEVPDATLRRIWDAARDNALTVDEWNSPLAGQPYALRHTCVSTWLNAGVAPTTIAKWAGHSVAVLLEIYAHCLAGGDDVNKRRIEQFFDDAEG